MSGLVGGHEEIGYLEDVGNASAAAWLGRNRTRQGRKRGDTR